MTVNYTVGKDNFFQGWLDALVSEPSDCDRERSVAVAYIFLDKLQEQRPVECTAIRPYIFSQQIVGWNFCWNGEFQQIKFGPVGDWEGPGTRDQGTTISKFAAWLDEISKL
jgi:hypothetical protein